MKANLPDIFHEGAISPSLVAESLQKYAANTAIGAYAVFVGQVRADVKGSDTVAAITYTAYQELALERMAEIRAEIFEKHPLTQLEVRHSLGRVAEGGICLLVLTAAAHRRAATEACNEVVERIKSELPVWGKECFAAEGHQWKINK
ncbi:MAG TPA: molybdenum cofactor biosynthesis protein MoaE [Anseongella sp.]|nr:molybdenum cofactor biosynthesis protein MoaE [Anseongella sp.]